MALRSIVIHIHVRIIALVAGFSSITTAQSAKPVPGTSGSQVRGATVAERTRPPVARVERVTDEYFGVKLVDSYRWMENPKNPDWLPFLKAQQSYTRSVLDAIPGRNSLLKRISALSGDATITAKVQSAGELIFFQQRPAGSENFKLFVRGQDGRTRTLIDPTTMKSDRGHLSLDWWEASNDGAYVAYGLSAAGSEESVLHVMHVASSEVLPERIDKTDFATPNWLPDNSGFFYNRLTGERGTPQLYLDSEVRLHRLRTNAADDPVIFKRGLVDGVSIESTQVPIIQTALGSTTALAIASDARPEVAAWSAPISDVVAGRVKWRRVCDFDDAVTGFAVLGTDLYMLENRSAPRGRVVRTSVTEPDFTRAVEVMPQGDTVIEGLAAAKDGVFVTIMDGGIQRVSRIGRNGTIVPLRLPFEGSVSNVYASPTEDGAYLDLTGWFSPRNTWRVDSRGELMDVGLQPASPIDVSPYDAVRGFAVAKDGVRIPYSMLYRKSLVRNGRNSTLLTAYGAYQASSTPGFMPRLLPFLDAGGVFVVANVRGGGEYGRAWHAAGQKETKPNTWRDLIAVSETLISEKVTASAHLAISGTSAGGITVGRAMTERPQLFAAVISNVGWSNPVRYVAEQNSAGDMVEWGSFETEAGFRGLLQMDSYQSVRDGTAYPAVLCVTGATDPRVAPFHAAKFAARLQAASSSGNPVLLRVDFEAGHGIGSTRSQGDALAADMYSFVLWRTGAKDFQTQTSRPSTAVR